MAVYILLFRGVGGKTQLPVKTLREGLTELGFDNDIYAVSLPEWRKLIANNPFPKAARATPKYVHAAVLAKKPDPKDLATVQSFAVPGEAIEIVDKVAYLHTPFGFGSSKLAEKFDSKIGVPNTARNWNSVLKLLELAEGL